MGSRAQPRTAAARLAATLPEVLASLKRSSIPGQIRADIIEVLQHTAGVARARQASIGKVNQQRSAGPRGRIREAVGVLPLDSDLHKLVVIVQRRLGEKSADARTIRDEIRKMRTENIHGHTVL